MGTPTTPRQPRSGASPRLPAVFTLYHSIRPPVVAHACGAIGKSRALGCEAAGSLNVLLGECGPGLAFPLALVMAWCYPNANSAGAPLTATVRSATTSNGACRDTGCWRVNVLDNGLRMDVSQSISSIIRLLVQRNINGTVLLSNDRRIKSFSARLLSLSLLPNSQSPSRLRTPIAA